MSGRYSVVEDTPAESTQKPRYSVVSDVSNDTAPVENKPFVGGWIGDLLKLNESAAGGNRELLRNLGSDNQGSAYLAGLQNPSKSETFQNQLLRTGIIPNPNGTTSTLNSFLGGVSGQMADLFTNPIGTALTATGDINLKDIGPAFKSIGSGLSKSTSGMFNKVVKPSIEEIAGMQQQAIDSSKGLDTVIKRTASADAASINTKYSTMKQDLGKQIKTLSDVDIKNAADAATLENRGDRFFNWARDISKRFGADYEKAIAGEKIATSDLHSAVGNALKERGIIDQTGKVLKPQSAWSDSERKVFDYYNKVGSKLPGTSNTTDVTFGPMGAERSVVKVGQEKLDLSQVDKDLKSIFASKEGTPYTSGDHILTQLRKNIADTSTGVGKIKVVRAKFAPELQAKNEAIKVLQPFNDSGAFDTTAGSNFFSRYANGKADPDELRWVEAMRKVNAKEGNIFQNLDNLASQKNELIKQVGDINQLYSQELKGNLLGHQESLAQNQMDAENHLGMLDALMKNAEKDKAVSDLLKTGAKWGAKLLVGGSIAGAGFKAGEALMPHR